MSIAEITALGFQPILWAPICFTVWGDNAPPEFHGVDVERVAI